MSRLPNFNVSDQLTNLTDCLSRSNFTPDCILIWMRQGIVHAHVP